MSAAAVVIAGIIAAVVVHEAAHFVAAKACGMKATEAFFGFGPRLWSTRRGETEYGVKAFPLGGYVRIVGMNPFEEVSPDDEERAFRNKPFWQRSVVVLAGVASHLVVAVAVFFVVALVWGQRRAVPVVDSVVPVVSEVEDLSALGLQRGDRIVAIDGVAPGDWAPGLAERATKLVVERDDRLLTLETEQALRPTPATRAGLLPGDRIVAIDGTATPTWAATLHEIRARAGVAAAVTVERRTTLETLEVTFGSMVKEGEVVGYLGVRPVVENGPLGPGPAVVESGRMMAGAVTASVRGLGDLAGGLGSFLAAPFTGDDVPLEERPLGPIGLVHLAGQTASLRASLILVGLVNVFMGLFNLLPLYPLDGGQFTVSLYERLVGRRVDLRRLTPVAVTVVVVLVVVGLVALYLDVVSPPVLPD